MKITELELLTRSAGVAAAFYGETLGLETAFADEFSVSLKAGSTILKFSESKETDPAYHFAFNIPCNQLHEAVQFMSERVELLDTGNGSVFADFKSWNAKSVYFFDNCGNIVEFIARRDLHNESPGPFGADSILCVSEIGIPASYPVQLAKNITRELPVPYFAKSRPVEDFAAVGDDEGLFIIVRTGRNWFPVNLPARKFYSRIKAVSGGEEFELTF